MSQFGRMELKAFWGKEMEEINAGGATNNIRGWKRGPWGGKAGGCADDGFVPTVYPPILSPICKSLKFGHFHSLPPLQRDTIPQQQIHISHHQKVFAPFLGNAPPPPFISAKSATAPFFHHPNFATKFPLGSGGGESYKIPWFPKWHFPSQLGTLKPEKGRGGTSVAAEQTERIWLRGTPRHGHKTDWLMPRAEGRAGAMSNLGGVKGDGRWRGILAPHLKQIAFWPAN